MIDTRLKGKVVLVIGANHGIGAATAKAFAAEDALVFIHYLRLPGGETYLGKVTTPGETFYRTRRAMSADEVIGAIGDRGGQVESWEADLADPNTISQLFNRVEETFGPVEVLINNAARCEPDNFIPQNQLGQKDLASSSSLTNAITSESHDRRFSVNSRAVALMMAEYAQRHIRRGARWGRIVNVSADGASGFRGEVSYGASKHAMESYSRAAAVSWVRTASRSTSCRWDQFKPATSLQRWRIKLLPGSH
jgi:3-oxoacyl-[acyl-carrier protein] reductase